MDRSSEYTRTYLLENLASAFAYFVVAMLGLEMALESKQVSVVWPATGVALALLFLRGTRLWPAIAIGSFAANMLNGAPLTASVVIAIGNALEALVGAALLGAFGFSPALKRVRDVAALFLLSAMLSPIISATIGVSGLCLAGVEPWTRFETLWSIWWIGDAVGDLVVAPFLFVWFAQAQRGWQLQRLGETTTLAVGLLVLSLLVFVEPGAGTPYPVHYLIFPAVIWSALRLGQHATATLVLGAAAVTTIATLGGRGPFVDEPLNASLLDVEIFMGVVSVTGLFLGAATAERNRAERQRSADYAQLRQSEERLALALAAGHMGAWEWDVQTGRMEWSETVEALHGIAPGAFRGTFDAFRELLHPEDAPRALEEIRAAIGDRSKYSIEFRTVWPDGSVRWIETSGQVIEDHGRAVRVVGVSRDVTEHKIINEALTRQAQQLSNADRRKDEFLAVLGHELRNPLAPLQNSVELLAHRASDQRAVGQARVIMQRQLRHLVRLVDDLLDVSRIRSGKIVMAKQRMELAFALENALELSRPGIDARKHKLMVSMPGEPIFVDADPTRLPQLLANLLNNAAKYTNEGGQISLTVEHSGNDVVVKVRDTGIGMTAEELSAVFELFAQAGRADHAVQGGLGVGLSLAKSLAELHGGSLTARSQGPGYGSEFTLRLPTASAVAAVGDASSASLPERSADDENRRILIVDDNVDAAESLGMLLTELGHEVRTAHGGAQAVSLAKTFLPEIMILDLGMPEMDGYAVARAIRADATLARTRLIALSGYGQPEDRRRTAEVGFDAHLIKPVEPEKLCAVMFPSRTETLLTRFSSEHSETG